MSLLSRKRTILAKVESVYGTDPTPAGSTDAMLVRNLNIQPINATVVSRDLVRPFLGNSDQLIADAHVSMDFEIELAGSGVAGTAPAWAALIKACGFGETVVASTSVTYAPISSSIPSLTLYFNVDGILHKITGARGTFELTFNVAAIPVLKFTFTGLYNAPSDSAAPSCDFTKFIAPKVVNTQNTSAFSLFSFSGYLENMSINLGADVQYRTLVGLEEVRLVDRKPSGTIMIEAPTIGSKDFFTAARNGTTGALAVTHGSAAGNIVAIAAPHVSLGNPVYQDSKGVQMLSLPVVLSPSTGNDELSIVLT